MVVKPKKDSKVALQTVTELETQQGKGHKTKERTWQERLLGYLNNSPIMKPYLTRIEAKDDCAEFMQAGGSAVVLEAGQAGANGALLGEPKPRRPRTAKLERESATPRTSFTDMRRLATALAQKRDELEQTTIRLYGLTHDVAVIERQLKEARSQVSRGAMLKRA